MRVTIIGGGPAGATAAMRLSQLGHPVTLFERAAGARREDGESLSPGIWPLLQALRIQLSGALPIRRSLIRWESEEVVERMHRMPQLAVMRSSFDAQLLAFASSAGARVVHAAASSASDFVIDASGRSSFTRAQRTRTSPPAVAMRAVFRGASVPAEARVEALEEGWLWGSPMPDGSFAAIACVDAGSRVDFFELLRNSQLFAGLPRSAAAVHCSDATTWAAEGVATDGLLLAGDAAHSLDPLSSSGVRSAMQSGLHAAIVVNTILRHPDRAPLALRFYEDTQRAAVAEHTRWTRAFYAESRFRALPFWNTRAGHFAAAAPPSADALVTLTPGLALADVPCVIGDLVESRRGIAGPTLPRPFVWIAGLEAVRLLEPLAGGKPMRRAQLVQAWRNVVPMEKGERIVDELGRAGVVVGA